MKKKKRKERMNVYIYIYLVITQTVDVHFVLTLYYDDDICVCIYGKVSIIYSIQVGSIMHLCSFSGLAGLAGLAVCRSVYVILSLCHGSQIRTTERMPDNLILQI